MGKRKDSPLPVSFELFEGVIEKALKRWYLFDKNKKPISEEKVTAIATMIAYDASKLLKGFVS